MVLAVRMAAKRDCLRKYRPKRVMKMTRTRKRVPIIMKTIWSLDGETALDVRAYTRKVTNVMKRVHEMRRMTLLRLALRNWKIGQKGLGKIRL